MGSLVVGRLAARASTSGRVGLGESEPIASNDTAEGRANNRRVEIEIFDAGEAVGLGEEGGGT